MRRKFMSMALTAAMVLSMAATPVFAEDTASDEGFNLNLCIASEPQTIDPALNSAVDGAIMCNHMFEGLAKWENDGEGNAVKAPGQAESWEKAENEDGTVTYTVKLRDGIKCPVVTALYHILTNREGCRECHDFFEIRAVIGKIDLKSLIINCCNSKSAWIRTSVSNCVISFYHVDHVAVICCCLRIC